MEVEPEAGGERRHVPARGSSSDAIAGNGRGRRCRREDQRRYLPPLAAPTSAAAYLPIAIAVRCFVLLPRPRGRAAGGEAAAGVANVEEQEEEEGQESAQQRATTTARHLRSIFTGSLPIAITSVVTDSTDQIMSAAQRNEKSRSIKGARNPLTGEWRKQSSSRPGSDRRTEVERWRGEKGRVLKRGEGNVTTRCAVCW